MNAVTTPATGDRAAWRQWCRARRAEFAASSHFATAQADLQRHLADLLVQLEPELLGLYWPLSGEFALGAPTWPAALPQAFKADRRMQYRRWLQAADPGAQPPMVDECGIPCADGETVVPDVVLVPCVGYAPSGGRLGYGGGYYDRWLASHPHVTAIGVAWSGCALSDAQLGMLDHDIPLSLILTEKGVVHG